MWPAPSGTYCCSAAGHAAGHICFSEARFRSADCLEVQREYYQNCFIYCQRATSSMGTVNKNSSYSPVGPWVCIFWVEWFIFMRVYVLFYLGQLSHFPSCRGASVTNLNEPPSSLLLPPRYCGLGAGFIPIRAIVNKKQCEMRGLFMSLVIHYWIGDVQNSQGIRLRNDLYCVGWGVKLYSLTHLLDMKIERHWSVIGRYVFFYV